MTEAGFAGIDSHYWITPALTLACAAVFGLLVGSFLNVVIHRLPLMMQAQWEAEAAELAPVATARARCRPPPPRAGADPAAAAPFNLVVPRSRCPHCGHQITAAREHPGAVVAVAARQVLGVQGPDLGRAIR